MSLPPFATSSAVVISPLMAERLNLPRGSAELLKLRKGHPDKVRCAALVRLRTAMENEWIAARLAMGGSTYVSSLIHRLLRDAKEQRTTAAHERALHTASGKVGK